MDIPQMWEWICGPRVRCPPGKPTLRHFSYWSSCFNFQILIFIGLPWWLSGKESACQFRRCEFDPWVGTITWRRAWQLTPVFLPGKIQGPWSLVGYNLQSTIWVEKELGMTKQLNNSNNNKLFITSVSSVAQSCLLCATPWTAA